MSREVAEVLGLEAEVYQCSFIDVPLANTNLIMTSPPYADRRKSTYGGVRHDEYVDWFLPYTEQFLGSLAEDGSFILNIKENCEKGCRSTYVMELVLQMVKQGWNLIDDYIWVKSNCMPGRYPNRFRDAWEHCFHFTKNKKFKFNQDDMRVEASDVSKNRYKRITETDLEHEVSATKSGFQKNWNNFRGRDTALPDNVLRLPCETCNVGHPAAFPVVLPTWFIQLLTDPGDLVVDPFCGSGTTLLAAQNELRKGIGFELKDEYVTIAEDRVKNEWRKIPNHLKTSS